MKLILMFVLYLLAVSVNAELFKWKDAQGSIIYSDQPPPGVDKAESEVKEELLPQIVTIPAPEVSPASKSTATSQVSKNSYQALAIMEPRHDSAIRENSGKVAISVQVEPYIFSERGHKLIVYLDGIEVSQGAHTTVILDNIDRGTHTARATIVNNKGIVLKEARPTVFTLQRYHN